MKQSEQFKHVILTRYNWDNIHQDFYGRDDAQDWMKERYELFKATRESVLSQGVDFDWILSFDKNTPASYVKKVCKKGMYPVFHDLRENTYDYETDWIITTRLDNDDQLLPGALKEIQERFEPKTMIIDIDYYQYDMETGKYYTSERRGPNSPFLSLVEPRSYVKGALCRPHNKLPTGYPSMGEYITIPAVKIRKRLALMVIHGNNVTNKIVGHEISRS